jgi:hypothetical protein
MLRVVDFYYWFFLVLAFSMEVQKSNRNPQCVRFLVKNSLIAFEGRQNFDAAPLARSTSSLPS